MAKVRNKGLSTIIHVKYALLASKAKTTVVVCMECKTHAWYLVGIQPGVLHLLGKYEYPHMVR